MIHYLRALAARIRGLFEDRRTDRDLDDEIETHLRLLTERYVRQGMSEAEAARAARRQFGNVTLLLEAHQEMRGIRFVETLIHDVRYGLWMLRRNPGFTFVAVLTLALGIGANTCVFSVLEAVLIKSLPYHEPGQLVWLANTNASLGVGQTFLNGEDILDYCEQAKSFAQIASWGMYPVNVSGGRKPERVETIYVTANFFQTLGVKPLLGRDFTPEDASEENDVVIISYGLWQRQFSGDPRVIGRKVRLADYTDEPNVIIGVMPADMDFPARVDMFTTYERQRSGARGGDHNNRTIARLKLGVTIAQAQAEIS